MACGETAFEFFDVDIDKMAMHAAADDDEEDVNDNN